MLVIDKVINRASSRINRMNPYGGKHTGVDLLKSRNEEENKVYSHSAGTVRVVVNGYDNNQGSVGTSSYGNYIEIDHGNGNKTRYAHLLKNTIQVSKGQYVKANTYLGVMGNSGNSTARHLHFEVFLNNQRVDPTPYLTKELPGSSLPNPISIYYKSHDKRYSWNPEVEIGSREYAGNFGYNIDAVYVDKFRVRVHDMVKKQWLPWVQNRNDYAGNLGNAIDGIQIDTMDSSYSINYRVHVNGGDWLDWVSGYHDGSNGYAGIYGRPIDAIQLRF